MRSTIKAGRDPLVRDDLLVANLVHRLVVDPSVDQTVGPQDRFPSAACTGNGVRRDGATAPLSCGETSLGSDRTGPACRNSGIAVSSTVRPSGGISERACFAEVAGVPEVLAGGPIHGDLQAHLVSGGAVAGAYARVASGADEWP